MFFVEKICLILIALSVGYILFIVASKEEGAKKTLGRLIAVSVITLTIFMLLAKALLCYSLGAKTGWSKYCGMKKSFRCGRMMK